MSEAEVTLAAGVWRGDTRVRRACVRAPGIVDQRELVEQGESLLPAERVTLLLGQCVEVGGERGPGVARELTVGDRIALLLELRRMVIGEAMTCVLQCPAADCAEQLELELRVGNLLVDGDAGGLLHELEVDDERVVLRLPSGLDEEHAGRLALLDPEAAARDLLSRCLVEAPDVWPPGLAEAVGEAITSHDPHAEIAFEMTCPVCERAGEVAFDAAAYVWQELAIRREVLEREVHLLASRYGWGEREILDLPPQRRARYLKLAELEAGAA